MESRRSQFVLKLLPSFTDFAFLMPLAYLFGTLGGARIPAERLRHRLAHSDRRVDPGASLRFPRRSVFVLESRQPWFAWEWLSDVLFAWLNALDGLRAVVLFTVALLCVTFTCFTCSRGVSRTRSSRSG